MSFTQDMMKDVFGLGPYRRHLPGLAGSLRTCIEVGVYEGQTASWLLAHVLTEVGSHYVGIDPWGGPGVITDVEASARANLATWAHKVTLLKENSQAVFLRQELPRADLIHVDGSHRLAQVAVDTVALWPLLLPGGIMVWHDYSPRVRRTIQVKPVVDWFLKCVDGQFDELWRGEASSAGVRKR